MKYNLSNPARSIRKLFILVSLLLFPIFGNAYIIEGSKWGSHVMGTGGGVVTWNFSSSGVHCAAESTAESCVSLGEFMPAGYVAEFERAFAAWQAVANISFVKVADGGGTYNQVGPADIRIAGHAFDWGAHGEYPTNSTYGGDIHFTTELPWTIDGDFQVYPIALHEIGHALGLSHTPVLGTVMAGFVANGGIYVYDLQPDDIAGIQKIYGPAVPLPGSIWLFGSALMAALGFKKNLKEGFKEVTTAVHASW